MKNVLITTEGIQRNLKRFKPLDAICEYIWNGFDADASQVSLCFHENELGLVNMIDIIDNGTGICYEELSLKFQKFNDSSKSNNDQNTTLPHGRRGIGRLTFFVFAERCRWETVYEKQGKKYQYFISMDRNQLNQYDDNGGKLPNETDRETGTLVRITQMDVVQKEEVIQRIKEEFFWFLELNKPNGFKILIDGTELNYEDLIICRETISLSALNLEYQYDVKFVHWKTKLGNEYSRIYYIGSDNKEKNKETTKLNRKADQFYHSVFVRSNYFDSFYWTPGSIEGQQVLFPNKTEEEYKKLNDCINDFIIKYRKKYLRDASDNYIKTLISGDIYPEFDDGVIGAYQKEQLDDLVGTLYIAQPKVFTGLNDDNKKILIRMLNLIIEKGNKPELFEILKQIIELTDEETDELARILKYTTFNRITRAIQLLSDRIKVIQTLKEIVFRKDYNSYEAQIQSIVEEHYWIFGEQYNLITAAEPDFELALRGLVKQETGVDEKKTINHPDKNKEMDIFMVRQDRRGLVTENVVVELKRPSILLGEKEVSQVKRYMRVIKSDPRFNAGKVKWTFYLVGSKYDTSKYIEGELESHKANGQPFLIHTADNGLTNIYVLQWSEIFDDFSRRYEFLMEKLKFEQSLWINKHGSAEEAVDSLTDNSAKMPEAVISKRNS